MTFSHGPLKSPNSQLNAVLELPLHLQLHNLNFRPIHSITLIHSSLIHAPHSRSSVFGIDDLLKKDEICTSLRSIHLFIDIPFPPYTPGNSYLESDKSPTSLPHVSVCREIYLSFPELGNPLRRRKTVRYRDNAVNNQPSVHLSNSATPDLAITCWSSPVWDAPSLICEAVDSLDQLGGSGGGLLSSDSGLPQPTSKWSRY